jgi:hypothetical protein
MTIDHAGDYTYRQILLQRDADVIEPTGGAVHSDCNCVACGDGDPQTPLQITLDGIE